MALLSISCPECKKVYERTRKQINAVVKRSGVWLCRPCATAKSNMRRSSLFGSTRTNKRGYLVEKTQKGWRLQHRVVMESRIGRELRKDELVHHIDGNKQNNSADNLSIEKWGLHTRMHHTNKRRSDGAVKNIRAAFQFRSTTKLTKSIVVEAKELHASGISFKRIARKFDVSTMTIYRAVRGESWKQWQTI